MLKWIFFDVGNVILNDDPAMAVYYREIYNAIKEQGNNVTFDQMLAFREKTILENRNGRHYVSVALKYLGRKKWSQYENKIRKYLFENWAAISPLMEPIVPVIETLAEKYNLGIIANQPSNAADILQNHGLLKYFKIHGFSQTVGLTKPDPSFFRWALEEANCAAEESLMIGDRIDNDVRPAKYIGMKTLWLPITHEKKRFVPGTELEEKYLASLKRACVSLLEPEEDAEMPDGTAQDFDIIPKEIERIENNL